MLASWKKNYEKPRQHIQKQRHYFADEGSSSQSYGFSNSHVWMWELDHEGWMQKNCYFWTVVLKKTFENPLHCKEIQPVNPKGNQSWIFIGRTDAEAPILWPPDGKSQLIKKDPDAGEDWRQEKRMTEDEMVGWHHWFNGHKFEHAPEMVKDGEAWRAAVYVVTKSQTRVSDWTTKTSKQWPCHSNTAVLYLKRERKKESFVFWWPLIQIK